jgi:hypothetical protein
MNVDLNAADLAKPEWRALLRSGDLIIETSDVPGPCIYLIGEHHQAANRKIGITGNLAARLKRIRTSSGRHADVLFAYPLPDMLTAKRIEHEVHQRLAEFRGIGEWFRVSTEKARVAIVDALESWRADG